MTAKEYLGRYRACCQQYIYLLEGIEQLEALAQKTTAAMDGSNVQTGLTDKVGQKVSMLADMRTEAEEQLNELAKIKSEIEAVILAVRDNKQRTVLYHRYILQKKWEQIAVDLDLDLRWIFRIHGEALQKIKFDH